MADARMQSHWLNNPDFDDLSDAAWRVFTGALMWSNGRGTDGLIPTRYLRLLHPEGTQEGAARELADAGLWEATNDGYQLTEWVKVLGQSTAETVEWNKAKNRERVAKSRAKSPNGTKPPTPTFREEEGDVTHYVTRDVRGDVGQRQDSDRDSDRTAVNEATGEVTSELSWAVATIPGSVSEHEIESFHIDSISVAS